VSSMFENHAPQAAMALVEALETQLPMLPDADQDFVLGCKIHIEVGGILTHKNYVKLRRIAEALRQRDTTTDAFESVQRYDVATAAVANANNALTMRRVLLDLAKVIDNLTPQERKFANMLAQKLQAHQAFTQAETQTLLAIHASKGF